MERYKTVDTAVGMIFVLSTTAVFQSRPTSPRTTAADIWRFATLQDIMEMAGQHALAGNEYCLTCLCFGTGCFKQLVIGRFSIYINLAQFIIPANLWSLY